MTIDLAKKNPRWLSVSEIAEYIGVSTESIYRWIESRQLPAHKVGKLWKFKTEEIDGWIQSGEADDNSMHFKRAEE